MPTIHPDYPAPLTWSALWDAIGDEYHNANVENREPLLIPTTKEMAYEMRDSVPPTMQKMIGILTGEPHHHNNAGQAVYSAFIQIRHDWFARYATVNEFRLLDSTPTTAN